MTDITTNAAPAAPAQAQTPISPPGDVAPGGAAPLSETASAASPAPMDVDVPTDPDMLDGILGPLQDMIGTGGPVLMFLSLLSVVALAIVLVKLWQFHRLQLGRLGPVRESLRRWQQSDAQAAIALVAGRNQPVAHLVHLALVGLHRPRVEMATLREELTRVASLQLESLRSHLRALEIIGTLSPLLGLLGTVLGMIEAFRQLEVAGSQVDPSILSGGIWQALLTTAVGLTVAIPVVLAHTWLERRVERCGHQMEDAVTQVFTRGLKAPVLTTEGRHHAKSQSEVGYAA
ncbi:MotA/TolQ/ExbB proton channel [Thiorhodococcus drewsii AZ1]|uniref:MotA/TolQ/ExbB proton channel n=1 Tax=Thiorhodococcus drewsii AZ1 TaxID=765913 RepID=G2E2Q4_9GAMM|nr:MotA/TolQ/ExbB proton channel family protein [Thiorhodococcus drewsii]EGV30608.1 MotA/TolQ/ExbB proton channel [Thiorhodococcus drewsii AZ1]